MTNVTVKITGDRDKLSEGRGAGLGFAFLKKLESNKYETVHPPSTCKDYLNDIVYVNKINKSKTVNAYGLVVSNTDLFKKSKYAYLYISPLVFHRNNYKSPHQLYNLSHEKRRLDNSIDYIIDCLNRFEAHMEFKTLSTYIQVKSGEYILNVPLEWVDSPYMISLYSLLVRALQFVDKSNPFYAVLSNNALDQGLLVATGQKIGYLLKRKKLPTYIDLCSDGDFPGTNIHNHGFNAWQAKDEKDVKEMYEYTTGHLLF